MVFVFEIFKHGGYFEITHFLHDDNTSVINQCESLL